MKTDGRTITSKVYIFAEMKTNWELDHLEDGGLPFKFRVKDFDYGNENCVRIMEYEVDIPIPAGIDLTEKCIENLREKIRAVEEECKTEVADLQQRIRNLSLIEYKPEASDNDEYVDPYDGYLKPGGTV